MSEDVDRRSKLGAGFRSEEQMTTSWRSVSDPAAGSEPDANSDLHGKQAGLDERLAEARRQREALMSGEVRQGYRGVAGSVPRGPRPATRDALQDGGRIASALSRASRSEAGEQRSEGRSRLHSLLAFALGAVLAVAALSVPQFWPSVPAAPAVENFAASIEAQDVVVTAPTVAAPPDEVSVETASRQGPPDHLPAPEASPDPPVAREGPAASASAPAQAPRDNPHPDAFHFPFDRAALERLEESLNLAWTDRRNVQLQLRIAGFDPGPIDGDFGPRTRASLEKWQSARGHHPSGRLNAATLSALRAETREELSRELRRIAAQRQAPDPEQVATSSEIVAGTERCARDEAGRVATGRSFGCDLTYLREDLAALFD